MAHRRRENAQANLPALSGDQTTFLSPEGGIEIYIGLVSILAELGNAMYVEGIGIFRAALEQAEKRERREAYIRSCWVANGHRKKQLYFLSGSYRKVGQ